MASTIRNALFRRIRGFLANEEGASLAEYALLVALIAVVAIGAITLLGGNISAKIQQVANAIGS